MIFACEAKRGAAPRCRPCWSEKLDVLGDDLAAVAVTAFGVLPARVVDAARHGELVTLGLVLAQREPEAVEDGDLVEFGILDRVAGFGVLLDLPVANDGTFSVTRMSSVMRVSLRSRATGSLARRPTRLTMFIARASLVPTARPPVPLSSLGGRAGTPRAFARGKPRKSRWCGQPGLPGNTARISAGWP